MGTISSEPTINHHAALELYRWRSMVYDWQLAPYETFRLEAIRQLRLNPGQTVMDVACGTGLSLPALVEAVGPQGLVIAIDQCPEMIDLARLRIQRHGWDNVQLILAPVDQADSFPMADAALLHFTHDVLQSPTCLDKVLSHLKPDARIACTGLKWTSAWNPMLNALVWSNAMQSVSTLAGLDQPWEPLLQRGFDLQVEQKMMGTVFIASGQRHQDPG